MSIYAVSDLHGCLDIYYKIKKLLKSEDKVYCLGDCGDRGSGILGYYKERIPGSAIHLFKRESRRYAC